MSQIGDLGFEIVVKGVGIAVEMEVWALGHRWTNTVLVRIKKDSFAVILQASSIL
jgi:hypothetical protein